MATEKVQNIAKVQEVMVRLSKTIQGSIMTEMETFVVNSINCTDGGDNISMPTNSYCCEENEEYYQRLLNLYNGTFGLFKEVNDIPDDIKVSQASLLDGLMYGYDVSDDSVELYTMNPNLLTGGMDGIPESVLKTIMKKNKVGLVKCFRVDVEYCPTDIDSFNYKLVDHRKDIDDSEKVFLVPYIAGLCLARAINSLLKNGTVLKTKQLVAGGEKVRCITLNEKVLGRYCDVGVAVQGSTAQFFPLKSFFYAPVLGAPSTTSMVTNINFFRLAQLKRVSSRAEITELGIQKPKDPMLDLSCECVAMNTLMYLKYNSPDEYYQIIEKLPKLSQVLPDVEVGNIMPAHISNYLHTIKREDMKKVLKLLPDAKNKVERFRGVFGSCRLMTPEELSTTGSIISLLKNNVCRFIIRKNDYSLSSLTCTNSRELLKEFYGDNYFALYESEGVRLRSALEEYELGRPLDEALLSNGFLHSEVNATVALEYSFKLMNEQGISKKEAVEEAIYTQLGKKKKAPAVTSNIMVRTINSYIENGSAHVYYRYLDPSKIEKAYIFERTE